MLAVLKDGGFTKTRQITLPWTIQELGLAARKHGRPGNTQPAITRWVAPYFRNESHFELKDDFNRQALQLFLDVIARLDAEAGDKKIINLEQLRGFLEPDNRTSSKAKTFFTGWQKSTEAYLEELGSKADE